MNATRVRGGLLVAGSLVTALLVAAAAAGAGPTSSSSRVKSGGTLTVGLTDRPWVYFVHSYAPEATDDVVATCEYGGPVTAMAARDDERVWATQFHPEKSGAAGLELLQNFVAACSD